MSLKNFSNEFANLCKRLLQTKLNGRSGHAYLFVGDDSQFLHQFVTTWAKVYACLNPLADGDACENCENCIAFANQCYPHLLEIKPQSKSRMILIDNMRNLQHDLSLATPQNKPKIAIIAEADCMGEQAQNAFLKTLEEPAKGTMLILYSLQPRKLLDTIRSRCQIISLLRNRKSYQLMIDKGVFSAINSLYPNAGAAQGLKCAKNLLHIFATLQKEAEKIVGTTIDEKWNEAMEGNSALRKRLENEQKAKLAAEYIQLREETLAAMQAWYSLIQLKASGIAEENLPLPEIVDAIKQQNMKIPNIKMSLANYALQQVDKLIQALSGNVNEKLAVEAFALEVSKKM